MKHCYSIFIISLLLLLFAGNTQAQTSWDFTTTPTEDWEALGNDATNWTKMSDTRYSNAAAISGALTANGVELTMTKGLTFSCSKADKIRIDKDQRIALNGKDIILTIPSLEKGQTVTVSFASANSSEERSFTVSNLEPASFSTTEMTEVSGTVTADGDVVITTGAGLSFYNINVSAATEETPEDSGTTHDVTMNTAVNQAVLTTASKEVKYYNTEDLSKISIDGYNVTVLGKDSWTDSYSNLSSLNFSKATAKDSTNGTFSNTDGKVEITDAKGWMESAYVKWKKLNEYTAYNVYIKGEDITAYTKIDKELVRSYGDSLRADMVGLKAGRYQMKVVPVSDGNELTDEANEATDLVVTAYDRQGFAHLNATGVGAYNDDGTLKSDARVIYITDSTAKTVTCLVKTSSSDSDGTLQTGLQAILDAYQKGYETRPLAVRLIGLIEKDDLDYISSSTEGLQIKGKSAYSPMNITIEGIGDDATVRGFGFLIRNSTHVEFRNFAIMRCMDDCLSFDTANRYVWVHNMDFFYGTSGTGDHAKGDGTVDLKDDTQYMTVSYNHFFDTGKNSLCGMTSETGPNYICYHHNWFDHSDSRNPRIRTMSVHVWNNYFDGVSKYGVGATTGSSVFVEANYFRATKSPMLSSMQGTDAQGDGTFSGEDGGIIKSYGNVYAETDGSDYMPITHKDNATSFDCYEADTRDEVVPDTYKTLQGGTVYDNFDTNSELMYTYSPDAASNVPSVVMGWNGAGRLNHGDFKWNFTSDDDSDNDINTALATAIDSYQSSFVGISE